jgi:hypothetical protein
VTKYHHGAAVTAFLSWSLKPSQRLVEFPFEKTVSVVLLQELQEAHNGFALTLREATRRKLRISPFHTVSDQSARDVL